MNVLEALKALATRVQTWAREVLLPEMRERPAVTACVVAVGAIGGLLYVGSSIVINGLIAGGLMAGAAGVILWKIKHSKIEIMRRIYTLVTAYPLASDVLLTAAALTIAPVGITGWIAATVCGLLASVWLLAESAEPATQAALMEPRQFTVADAEVVGVTA